MGQDGFVGSRELVRNGSRVFVQDMPTSAVWGMPGIIARSNLVEQVLPLEAIGQQLVAAVTVSRRASGRIGAGKKVLIVDDAVVMRMMIKNILTKNGFEVVGEAENGSLAVQKYRALQPDIVTMDMVMPYMDGISAVKAIVAEFPNAKIIMCTSMGQQELVVQAIQAGAKSFITKPFQPTKIVEAVEKVLA
jgi:two-component system chemotaxis response regulator CheY